MAVKRNKTIFCKEITNYDPNAYGCVEGRAIEKEIFNKKECDCALQHIKAFQEQAVKGVKADFGEPCQNCIHRETCKFDWFSILSPIRSHSNVKISMAVQEPNLQLDSIPRGISQGTGTHHRMDKKTCQLSRKKETAALIKLLNNRKEGIHKWQ